MAKSKRSFPQKSPLSLGQQILDMNAKFPSFRVIRAPGEIVWIGKIQPTSLSEIYTVKILYKQSGSPNVWVKNPELCNRGEESIPHLYPGKRLCLYLPKAKEWTQHHFISETIVPWASLWLYHYEIWHATGQWLGGGIHPRRKQDA